jgi:hypothetical protein
MRKSHLLMLVATVVFTIGYALSIRPIWITSEIFGHIDLGSGQIARECIGISVTTSDGVDSPVEIDATGRFHFPAVKKWHVWFPGDVTYKIRIETCRGKSVVKSMCVHGSDRICRHDPAAVLLLVSFSRKGDVEVREKTIVGMFRKAVSKIDLKGFESAVDFAEL